MIMWLLLLFVTLNLCTYNDPVDPKKKTADCNYCNCANSQMYGKHSYYNGKCLQCGKNE